MTVTQRKVLGQPEDAVVVVNEPGVQFQCDSCACDVTHTIRIKCADPICATGEGVDICPPCFCEGKEFGEHKRGHAYRVIEFNSYPIFSEDWGADEELLLLKGMASQGIGNWKKIAEHVGTQTKEEVEKHYNSVYVDSPHWPHPQMDLTFDIPPDEFQERKRKRITEMNAMPISAPKPAPTSAPGVHEIATFLPGRLEFEHELDHDAEDLVKDLEFGVVMDYGGQDIPEDENDKEVLARIRWEEERANGITTFPVFPFERRSVSSPVPAINGSGSNGVQANGENKHTEDQETANGTNNTDDDEEPTQLPPFETEQSLAFKLTLLEMYFQRVDKRLEGKGLVFDRGLLEYKKLQVLEKKRSKEDKDILHRLRPFARLQTADDYEAFSADILYEAMLRKKIQDLQSYRRVGLVGPADIEKYHIDLNKRTTQPKGAPREHSSSDKHRRQSSVTDRSSVAPMDVDGQEETTSKLNPSNTHRKRGPLNLANSPSLHLLSPAEQTLCAQLHILPKPYLVVKETLMREYARRGGKLRRREARDLVKIDANKTSRVWDFLAQAGFLQINVDPTTSTSARASTPSVAPSQDASLPPTPLLNGISAPNSEPATPVIPPSARRPSLSSWAPPP
ncbi:unnamed protein product [Mycena citricolor]|uniref:Transcriptional adapter 2 n=1 Tax=Mycena citricolor TaxID=2018698 RepID=A0AAD2HN34_9AGAR|nr:unnamed protein product [Mycena citricolor]